ncbi:MAG: histidinol-phosphate aminotransferase family protein [Chloroflexi bacterium]|nr:histidinol-phosphate aminotransferase family protein [Nitrospirota bacterium]MBI5354169.1 histidinol-phosphate aminotransferase family protein [Chloroflexota bacterium]MBI5714407.1 histidinol-phosphate aminotransferase family protein [Chloroflexota bacterium]
MPITRPELNDLYRSPVPQAGRYGRLRLDKNENTVGFPAAAIEEMLTDVTPHFLAAYPEPGTLYQKLAKWHGLNVDNVLLTAGSEMAIRYLFETYLDRGNEIVILNPSFAMFEVYARLCGAKLITIDYQPDFSINLNDLLSSISPHTKLVAIANPNNPTGTVIAESDFIRIVQKALECDAVVLADEAYYYFYNHTMVNHLDRFSNLVVTRTFSKACGLAGIRLGYALGHPSIIAEIRKLLPIDHGNAFALKFGEYIVDHEHLIWQYVAVVEKGKTYLIDTLTSLGLQVRPSYANFILVDVGSERDRICDELERRDILVGAHLRLPFSANYIRVTIGTVAQMEMLVNVLKSLL